MSSTTEQYLSRTTAETFENLALIFADRELNPEQASSPLDVTVSVDFRGPQVGRLVLKASARVLPSVAANMLGGDPSRSAALQRDALGELANVICGNVLPMVAGADAMFRLSAPRVHDVELPSSRDGDAPEARTVLGVEDGRVEASLYFFADRARSSAA